MKKKFVIGAVTLLVIVGAFIVLQIDTNKASTIESFVENRDTRDIVEELENDLDEKIAGAVWQDSIELTYGNESLKIYDEKDEFYVSIAPYVNNTHG